MTIREALSDSVRRLSAAGVPDSGVEAEWIAAHSLGLSRPFLRIRSEDPVPEVANVTLNRIVEARCRRIPLQHLLGTAPFLDLELLVDGSVLVPRPETEVLAMRAGECLEEAAAAAPAILDVGTGSGCLAIALARRFPKARVEAVDVSGAALETAGRNAVRCGVPGIRFRLLDFLGATEAEFSELDLLVSNPTYIPSAEIPSLEPEVRDHDPGLALDGGGDGLDFYRHLARVGPAWVRPGGWMALEFGDGQAGAIAALFEPAGGTVSVEKDLSGRERLLIVRLPRALT